MERRIRQRLIALCVAGSILAGVSHVCHHHEAAAGEAESSALSDGRAHVASDSHDTAAMDHPDHDQQVSCPCICHVPIVMAMRHQVDSVIEIFATSVETFCPPQSPVRDPIDPPPWRS